MHGLLGEAMTAASDEPVTGGSVAGSHRVVFTPSGRRGQVEHGKTVLDAARSLGVDLDSVCGGRGICGRCQVAPVSGEVPTWGITVADGNLSDPDRLEAAYRGKRPLADGRRLGCALKVYGDAVVDVPSASQLHRQIVRKDVAIDHLTIDPLVVLRYVTPHDGGDGDQRSATERVCEALATAFDLQGLSVAVEVLPRLHGALADRDAGLTAAIRDDEVVAVWPGFVERALGAAIDVGSTTIAGHLCDLTTGEILASAGRMNPQIRFGEDLMSRVSYSMMHEAGAQELTGAVRGALDDLLGELAADAGEDRDRILELVLVGNPVMHHLVLAIDPTPLGQAPFTLATSAPIVLRARDLDLDAANARAYLAPCIAGHVGADTAAVILSEAPHTREQTTLIVDVGTNAEIVLGDRRQLLAASSPTGPAFEGAQISAGQRATTGAIERVRIDPTTLEPRFKVIGSPVWSDDPDFGSATAQTGVTGICGSGIVEVISELFLAGVIDSQGVIRGELAATNDRIVTDGRTASYVLHRGVSEVRVTQNDVRAIQLAKAALRAGIDLLLEHAGLAAPDEVRLAGAFGAQIDPVHAMVLGLVPDRPLDHVRAVGNAAGSGALRALLSRQQREELESVVARVTRVETATEPRFQELFVAALAFPHTRTPTPHLAEVVSLPAPTTSAGMRAGRRRGGARPDASTPAPPSAAGPGIATAVGTTTSTSPGAGFEQEVAP